MISVSFCHIFVYLTEVSGLFQLFSLRLIYSKNWYSLLILLASNVLSPSYQQFYFTLFTSLLLLVAFKDELDVLRSRWQLNDQKYQTLDIWYTKTRLKIFSTKPLKVWMKAVKKQKKLYDNSDIGDRKAAVCLRLHSQLDAISALLDSKGR